MALSPWRWIESARKVREKARRAKAKAGGGLLEEAAAEAEGQRKGKSKGKNKKGNDTCHVCGGYDHWVRDCPGNKRFRFGVCAGFLKNKKVCKCSVTATLPCHAGHGVWHSIGVPYGSMAEDAVRTVACNPTQFFSDRFGSCH